MYAGNGDHPTYMVTDTAGPESDRSIAVTEFRCIIADDLDRHVLARKVEECLGLEIGQQETGRYGYQVKTPLTSGAKIVGYALYNHATARPCLWLFGDNQNTQTIIALKKVIPNTPTAITLSYSISYLTPEQIAASIVASTKYPDGDRGLIITNHTDQHLLINQYQAKRGCSSVSAAFGPGATRISLAATIDSRFRPMVTHHLHYCEIRRKRPVNSGQSGRVPWWSESLQGTR